MRIAEIIDRLIYIKDNHEFPVEDLNAINNACNLLEHNFDCDSEAELIIDNITKDIRNLIIELSYTTEEDDLPDHDSYCHNGREAKLRIDSILNRLGD